MSNLKKELNEIMLELGLVRHEPCSLEENDKYQKMERKDENLPDGISSDEDSAYPIFKKIVTSDLSTEEINNLMMYRQTLYLKSIKSSMIFFVVLSIISLIVSFIFAFPFLIPNS